MDTHDNNIPVHAGERIDTHDNNIPVHAGERVDDLHRNGLMLIQNPSRFCFGVDAVILSGFTKVNTNETVMDLCTGSGVIPILLAGKTKGLRFDGLEIQAESAEMAQRSVRLNHLDARVRILEGDVRTVRNDLPAASYAVVTANPPYLRTGAGETNMDMARTIARHETLCTMDDLAVAAAWLLQPQGRFYLVHRPDRLTDVLVALRTHALEPKVLRFVHSRAHKPPILLLVEAVRNGKPSCKVREPLVIYQDYSDMYTDEIQRIYYD